MEELKPHIVTWFLSKYFDMDILWVWKDGKLCSVLSNLKRTVLYPDLNSLVNKTPQIISQRSKVILPEETKHGNLVYDYNKKLLGYTYTTDVFNKEEWWCQ